MIEDDYVRYEVEKATRALRDADIALTQVHEAVAKLKGVDFPILHSKMVDAGMPGIEARRLRHNAEDDLKTVLTDLSSLSTSLDLLTADFRHISEDFERVVAERNRAAARS